MQASLECRFRRKTLHRQIEAVETTARLDGSGIIIILTPVTPSKDLQRVVIDRSGLIYSSRLKS